jgi:hypothetical protein
MHAIDTGRMSGWDHLPQIVQYETSAIEAAKHPRIQATGTADISCVQGVLPFLKENTVVVAFTKNLPAIVADLKAGVFRESYADAPGWLVFHQEKNELTVMEINDFGKDFLTFCDGNHSLKKIAGILHRRYAEGLSAEAFFEVCRETAQELENIKLLENPASLVK